MSALYFALTKIILQPLPMLLILVGAGLISLCRRYGWRRRLCALAPFVGLVAICTPAVVYPVIGARMARILRSRLFPRTPRRFVVLGGGIVAADRVRERRN